MKEPKKNIIRMMSHPVMVMLIVLNALYLTMQDLIKKAKRLEMRRFCLTYSVHHLQLFR